MMGAIVFIWVLMQYITDNYPQMQLVFSSVKQKNEVRQFKTDP